MEEFNLLVEKIAGTPSGNYSASVFNQKATLASGDLGTLVGCILASGEQEAIQVASRDVFEFFPKKLEISEEGILETLGSAREAAIKYLEGQDYEISFVFAFFCKNACFIVRLGEGVKVLVFDPPKSDEITFDSGSGPMHFGQLYLIATEKFLESFDPSGFLEKTDIDYGELVDGLATDISAAEGACQIGAVFVQVKDGEEIGESSEEEAVSIAVEETVSEETAESRQDFQKESGIKSLFSRMSGFGAGLLREFKRLRHGDLGAILRLRQHVMLVVIGVILVLAASVVFTIWQKGERAKDMEFGTHLAAANAKFNEGVSLVELNKSRARQDFVDAQKELGAAVAIHANDQSAKKLAADIAAKLKETDVTSNISFEEAAPLPGVNSISFAGKNIAATNADKLFIVNTSSKTADEVKGAGGGISATVFDNKAFVLTGSGVVRQDLSGGTQTKIQVSSGGQDVGVFFGNIYVLFGNRQSLSTNKQSFSTNKIAKITPIVGGYAPETDYLAAKTDFLPSSRFVIDGSIWVTKGDRVLKFIRGAQEDFQISGLSGKLGELGPIYTDGTLDNLYVVDKVNSALLVIGKDGIYKKAYQAPEFGKASDILVTDDASILYVAVDGKVLSASIK
ncbi:MAG: hypothetical protein Q7S45_02475 [Candidatus Curtissbacteria bacterium]|nr:hypothetical protein [Candidatus Curtissbacteria bacterium]